MGADKKKQMNEQTNGWLAQVDTESGLPLVSWFLAFHWLDAIPQARTGSVKFGSRVVVLRVDGGVGWRGGSELQAALEKSSPGRPNTLIVLEVRGFLGIRSFQW